MKSNNGEDWVSLICQILKESDRYNYIDFFPSLKPRLHLEREPRRNPRQIMNFWSIGVPCARLYGPKEYNGLDFLFPELEKIIKDRAIADMYLLKGKLKQISFTWRAKRDVNFLVATREISCLYGKEFGFLDKTVEAEINQAVKTTVNIMNVRRKAEKIRFKASFNSEIAENAFGTLVKRSVSDLVSILNEAGTGIVYDEEILSHLLSLGTWVTGTRAYRNVSIAFNTEIKGEKSQVDLIEKEANSTILEVLNSRKNKYQIEAPK